MSGSSACSFMDHSFIQIESGLTKFTIFYTNAAFHNHSPYMPSLGIRWDLHFQSLIHSYTLLPYFRSLISPQKSLTLLCIPICTLPPLSSQILGLSALFYTHTHTHIWITLRNNYHLNMLWSSYISLILRSAVGFFFFSILTLTYPLPLCKITVVTNKTSNLDRHKSYDKKLSTLIEEIMDGHYICRFLLDRSHW